MLHLDFDTFYTRQAFGETFGKIHRPMVSSMASKSDLQMALSGFVALLHGLPNAQFRRIEKAIHLFPVVVEEIYHRLVESRISTQPFLKIRIWQFTAVKYEPALAGIFRDRRQSH